MTVAIRNATPDNPPACGHIIYEASKTLQEAAADFATMLTIHPGIFDVLA